MRRICLMLAASPLLSVTCLAATTLKGHSLGEGPGVFLGKDPGIASSLKRCHAENQEDGAFCKALILVFEEGRDGTLQDYLSDDDSMSRTSYDFEGGHLTAIRAHVAYSSFDAVVDDVSRRMRAKPVLRRRIAENAFGATWVQQDAYLRNGSEEAVVLENNGPGRDSCDVLLTFHRAVTKRQITPSPLD